MTGGTLALTGAAAPANAANLHTGRADSSTYTVDLADGPSYWQGPTKLDGILNLGGKNYHAGLNLSEFQCPANPAIVDCGSHEVSVYGSATQIGNVASDLIATAPQTNSRFLSGHCQMPYIPDGVGVISCDVQLYDVGGRTYTVFPVKIGLSRPSWLPNPQSPTLPGDIVSYLSNYIQQQCLIPDQNGNCDPGPSYPSPYNQHSTTSIFKQLS